MLTQLLRLAMITWGPLWRSTPTSVLEILGYLPPQGPLLTRRSGQSMDPNKEYSQRDMGQGGYQVTWPPSQTLKTG
jgi:hypothetical protein